MKENSNKKIIFAVAIFLALVLPLKTWATMTSETYSIDSGRIGTGELSLPYSESESYSTQATGSPETAIPTVEDNNSNDDDDDDESSGSKKNKKSSSVIANLANRFFGGDEEDKKDEQNLLPKQLFDINLEIDDATISDIKKLSARVLFTSFGTEPTPVDLTFVILNEAGVEVYRDEGSDADVTVETEAVFNKSFENAPELSLGKYTLVLTTLYNADVKDEFTADFEVVNPAENLFGNIISLWWLWLSLIFVIFLIIKKKKKNGRKNKKSIE